MYCGQGLPIVCCWALRPAPSAPSTLSWYCAQVAPLLYGSLALSRGLSDGARRQMAWWLGGTAVWVYSMVVLGGVTRLTRSGLSMTDWKFTGEDKG